MNTPLVWEYLVLPESERGQLGELGLVGWELVAIGGNERERLLYLKRPQQSFRERVTLDQRAVYFEGLDRQAETKAGSGA